MLNPFPSLLTYSLLGPMILRIILGVIFVDLGRFKLTKERERWIASLEALHIGGAKLVTKILGGVEIIGGLMLVVGYYTQIAALVFVLLTGAELYIEYKDAGILRRDITFYLLLLAISLSLLLTGAGAYAFDIPL